MKAFSYFLLILGTAAICAIRIVGVDSTEGQIVIEYWMWWVFSIVSILAGLMFYRD